MSATMAASLVNGYSQPVSEDINEIQEYEKILKLRDEIFAGTHPRLTVPAQAIRKVSPSSAALTSSQPSFPIATPSAQLQIFSRNGAEEKQNIEQNVNNNTASAQMKPATTSGIDPVLLMKSDELVRAETQLHRQRLEKALRDQFEQKRLDARKKPAAGEAKPDFDVAAVLAKALEVAKPEGVNPPKEEASNSDSYDENSLYSSRAPDSTPEVGELEDGVSSHTQNIPGGSFGANGAAEPLARSTQQVPNAMFPPRVNSPAVNSRKASGAVDLSALENDEDEEEGEYSPPEAVEQFTHPGDSSSQTMVDPRIRPLRRYSELEQGLGSPGDNVRIVRNHILNPIAPQPSRVSPLAIAKDPLSLQNTRTRNGRANQRGRNDQSPDGSGQGLHPRKKRKLDKKADRRKRHGGSPDIKDEPVSPPPFHDVQPLGSGKPRPPNEDRPIVIDDGPVREVRYIQAPDPYLSSPIRPMSRQADPMMPLTEPRIISRATMRPMRDETDLRRVASMHNMRVEQPREYMEPIYDSPSRGRAASYVRVDSPMRMEPPRLVQEMPQQIHEREATQSVRVVQSPAPAYREIYREAEPEIRYIPEPMPPPPMERIVVDQYGRRFREIIQDRSSVAPRAYSTFPDRAQPSYYESYDHDRGQSMVMEARQDPRMGQDMAPPPQMVRQIADPGPEYREILDPGLSRRSGSVRPVEPVPRQPVYLDERAEYRAPVRVGSVRPTGPRFEEMLPPPSARAGSVRPGVREGSVFVDDRSQVRREYLPVEAPRYRVVEPETRYVDAQGREITYVDGSQDMAPRYVQRY